MRIWTLVTSWTLEEIVGYCSSLVTVSDDGKVSLAHFSVKEFLTSPTIKDALGIYYVGEEEVHAELAEMCLTYLNYRDFDKQKISSLEEVSDLVEKFSFLEYASKSWAIHAQHVSTSEGQIHVLIERLFHSSIQRHGNYNLWLQVYYLQHRRNGLNLVSPPHASPLYYASYFGLPKIVDSLLDEGAERMIGEGPDDALSASALEGRAEVMKILLQRCFEGHSKESLGHYLYLAASKGHEEATAILLEWGAPIEAKSGKHGTALQVAALEGHPTVVSALLQRGANFKLVDAGFGIPLSAAAETGHRLVTQLLLDAGTSVNGRGGWYGTPLIAAIVGKDELSEAGVDVNAAGGVRGSALVCAAAIGSIVMIDLLVSLGVPTGNTQDMRDALIIATSKQYVNLIRHMIDLGADVDGIGLVTSTNFSWTALALAAQKGNVSLVETILGLGADVNANAGLHRTCSGPVTNYLPFMNGICQSRMAPYSSLASLIHEWYMPARN
jgi:ankyrin repeat protein